MKKAIAADNTAKVIAAASVPVRIGAVPADWSMANGEPAATIPMEAWIPAAVEPAGCQLLKTPRRSITVSMYAPAATPPIPNPTPNMISGTDIPTATAMSRTMRRVSFLNPEEISDTLTGIQDSYKPWLCIIVLGAESYRVFRCLFGGVKVKMVCQAPSVHLRTLLTV